MKTKIIGVTGSIAMGKSHIAKLFKNKNIPVFDADYEIKIIINEQNIIDEIKLYFPEASTDNKINAKTLANIIFDDRKKLSKLQSILMPSLEEKLNKFIEYNKNYNMILLDIPLLFEQNYNRFCNYTINVSCSKYIQTTRALKRSGMNTEKLSMIKLHQFSSIRKKLLADYNINTGISLNSTLRQFNKIYKEIKCAK